MSRLVSVRCWLAVTLWLCAAVTTQAQTGTFLDKVSPADVRVVTYNLGGFNNGFSDSGFQFADGDWEFVPSNARVVDALDADVWAFQEINSRSAADIRSAMNRADPLPDGAEWNVFRFSNQAIASRYGFADTVTSVFGSPRRPTIATIDLPNTLSADDLHLVNIHLKAGGTSSDEDQRLNDVDRIIQYLDDAKMPGDPDMLVAGTPFIVLGDYNTASTSDPIDNLAQGDITDENVFGPDTPPDWDGTALTVPTPRHNTGSPSNWTWRSSNFSSRLDYHAYSDSVMTLEKAFVLNTQIMSSADLLSTGLQANDVLFDPGSTFWDHLPVVVDYGLSSVIIPEPVLAGAVLVVLAAARRRRI